MSDTNCRQSRLLLFILFTLLALLPVTASAAGSTVWVKPPNGSDDTANIQAAVNACLAQPPGCTVQLRGGRYFTRQLVAYNFRGTFKGMGKNYTTLEALPNLVVNMGPNAPESICAPDTTSCFWPSLIVFVNGHIDFSDLAIAITAAPGTATMSWSFGGSPFNALLSAVTFMGQHVNVCVDRIRIEGQPDPTNSYGFNVVNGLHFAGMFPRSQNPWDWDFLTGVLNVRSSLFSGTFAGISQDGFVRLSEIVIGGTQSTGNHFEGNYNGIDLEQSENSFFDISYNESSGNGAAMWIIPWQSVFVPAGPSHYLIHNNRFSAAGQYGEGIYLLDDPNNPWIQATIWSNRIDLLDTLAEGIGANFTNGTSAWRNRILGTAGADAIGLWSAGRGTVIGNNVSGLTVDPDMGNSQIFLDSFATQNVVQCLSTADTVLDQGTGNTVVGCGVPAFAALKAAPATRFARPTIRKNPATLR